MSDLDEGLIWASKNGKIELVQLLIENGIDVNAVDDDGFTALRHASKNSHLEIVKLLTKNKARCEIDEGLLWNIVKFNKKEILKELTTNGLTIINFSNHKDMLLSEITSYDTGGKLDREEINEILRENGLKFCYEVYYWSADIRLIYKLPAKGSSIFKNCKSFGVTPLLTNEEFQMISVEEAIDYMEDLEKINKKCGRFLNYAGLVKDLNSIN